MQRPSSFGGKEREREEEASSFSFLFLVLSNFQEKKFVHYDGQLLSLSLTPGEKPRMMYVEHNTKTCKK